MDLAALVSRLDQALAENACKRQRARFLRRQATGARTRAVAIGACYLTRRWARLARVSRGSSEDTRPPKNEPVAKLARMAILAGRIPTSAGDHTRESRGRGASCTICGDPISRQQTDITIEFGSDG